MKFNQLKIWVISGIIILLAIIATITSFGIGNYDTGITGISAFATLITALFIYFTLIEMQEQRKSTIQPSITILKSNNFIINYSDNPNYGKFVYDNELTEKKQVMTDSPECGLLSLYNLGCGSAKNIKWSWDFNLERFFKIFPKLQNIEQKNTKESIAIWETNEKKLPKYHVWFNQEQNNHLNYILPITLDQRPVLLGISEQYCQLVGLFINLEDQVYIFNRDYEKIPELILNIYYEDISGNGYSKTFKFRLNIFTTSKEDTQISSASGEFILTEEKSNQL